MPIPNRERALKKLLEGISHKRFRELNEIWYAAFQASQKRANREMRQTLKPGAVVQFALRGGVFVHGAIERVMKTRAVVHEIDDTGRRIPGRSWRVTLSMLKPSTRKVSETTSD